MVHCVPKYNQTNVWTEVESDVRGIPLSDPELNRGIES